jgi:predicted metal-binding membrane protein
MSRARLVADPRAVVPVVRNMTASPTQLEAVLKHERRTLAVVLVGIPLICWVWVIAMARDMYGSMTGASAWMMTSRWDAGHVLLLWAMWAAMMAGMMLPTATPVVLIYAGAARTQSERSSPARRIYALAMGYVAVWALFSVSATGLQRALATLLLLNPMMEPSTPTAAAALLIIAGVYQLLPVKQACLRVCRSPLALLASRWRGGVMGAFRMGAEHGIYCLGCCWALMLLLFAGGVMNLVVIAALTVWVAFEKLAPFGERSAKAGGVLLLAVAGWLLWA